MADIEKLALDVEKFLSVYRILGPESKAAFEAQMDKLTQNVDEKTQKLYRALFCAAKDGLRVEDAIENMKKAVSPACGGISPE